MMRTTSTTIERLTAIAQADGYNEAIHMLIGKEYLREGRYMEAVAKFEHVTELDPEFPEAWRLLAESYEKALLPKEAQAAAETARIVEGHK